MSSNELSPVQQSAKHQELAKYQQIFASFARKVLLKKLTQLKTGYLVIQDEISTTHVNPAQACGLSAHIKVHHLHFYSMVLARGSIGAGEAYIKGYWSTDDLTQAIQIFCANVMVSDQIEQGVNRLFKPALKFKHWLNKNNITGSKRNISAHYDLGNEMYKLFLDPKMMYSSAIYPTPEADLTQAAEYKLQHICDRLDLNESHHLLEIGTGWGGMAIFAAQYTGCKVTTTTISKAQFDYAKQAVIKAGLEDKVNVIMLDYRELEGQYDRLVSVEMIEAVGAEYYPAFFKKCASLLKPDGAMLIQAITIADQRYDYYMNHVDFIQKYIFPGGCLPSVEAIAKQVSQSTDMVIRNIEDIGFHYAKTLADWRDNFLDNLNAVRQLGYDQAFINMWIFYLCYCEAGFKQRSISTIQVLVTKPECFDV
ncbi:cyclopropane-fatty-acyl-phospholipid synthase family protein [Catenovulum sp. 2E275]|uniref:SAM-dependent methyltransferase n=1 Tax=Catenovulum sp. 2E275 TaxID=2980497 RepID=UPI0021CEA1A8|nr:cyclopropane-fatty-acyl-phospholipid synthase family protein [Catenovulum sp. 2E275]MCU4674636.1 cyclopropane-fatty-acyl-phospholipid synthase family protein [Catenovulum sp. 2E275]